MAQKIAILTTMISYELSPNHVHIWRISLDSESVVTQCRNMLSSEEQERSDRFIFEKHRRRFIFAHYALRKILSHYLYLPPEHIEFEVLSHGKPQLIQKQNPHQLEFNLSHSGETALVGLRTEKMIGIDIEYHRDREFLGIAEHVFSEKECVSLCAMNEVQQVQAFFHIWVQKEAFIKAVGQGLSYPLKDFSVSPLPPATLLESLHEAKSDWFLHSFEPNKNASAAIVTLNPVEKISYFDFRETSNHAKKE